MQGKAAQQGAYYWLLQPRYLSVRESGVLPMTAEYLDYSVQVIGPTSHTVEQYVSQK